MKKLSMIICAALVGVLLAACGSHRSLSSNKVYDDNSLKIGKAAEASNNYKIIIDEKRVSTTYGRTKEQRKQLKRLTLTQAKEKVLQEAVIEHDCAMIAEPNYKYDMKGKRVVLITVVGYPGRYNFNKDTKE